jgi:hypothetical protein
MLGDGKKMTIVTKEQQVARCIQMPNLSSSTSNLSHICTRNWYPSPQHGLMCMFTLHRDLIRTGLPCGQGLSSVSSPCGRHTFVDNCHLTHMQNLNFLIPWMKEFICCGSVTLRDATQLDYLPIPNLY